jgi:hypothetical protein
MLRKLLFIKFIKNLNLSELDEKKIIKRKINTKI